MTIRKKLSSPSSWFKAFVLFVILTNLFSLHRACASDHDSSIVDLYGKLRVTGNHIVSQQGEAVALRGMSLFWSQWMGQYYNYECIKWLRNDWQCTVIRAAMGIESGGYLTHPDAEMAKIKIVIDACIDLGLYVVVDWHDHHAQQHQSQAISFFKEIAALYGNTPNLIYEIFNEPEQVSWTSIVKPYSEAVINEIRALDADNIIIVGTPTWSQDVDIAAANPLNFENIVYALHFYAATHKQYLRDKARVALDKGVALFVSEFGTCESTGTGIIDYAELARWSTFMDDQRLSWCNWSIADKDETSAALKSGASAIGHWSSSDLTASGTLIRQKIIAWNEPILSAVKNSERFNYNLESYQINNYPNPFNAQTNLEFFIASPQKVKIDIYNLLGEKISTLLDKQMETGKYNILFNSAELPSGTYFYKMQTEKDAQIKGMKIIK